MTEVLDRVARQSMAIKLLVSPFFKGNKRKIALWYKTKNPSFGGISPQDMVIAGRFEHLKDWVKISLSENKNG